MSQGRQHRMAPDSHNSDMPDLADPVPELNVTTTTTSPLPTGILFKGNKSKKRVTFRDSNLVNIREIPPRSRSGSSSDEESDDDDDSCSSDSEDDSDSDSEDEQVTTKRGPAAAPAAFKDRAVTVTRTSASPPVSTLTPTSLAAGPRVRPERAPIPWSSIPTFTTAKGSYDVAASPASKVVSLVSQITGVSTAATQAHIKQRNAATAAASPTPKPAPAAVQPKKAPAVVRVEKKVKKITPTLDNVMTSQTVRSVQKHGAMSESLPRGGGGGKTVKKKRVWHKRQDGGEKRKAATSRKGRDPKHVKGSKVNGRLSPATSEGKGQSKAVNGLSAVRDSLSLPPLGGSDDSVLLQSSRALQHMSLAKSTVYTLDGFIFPGDPTHQLAAGVKAASTMSAANTIEDLRLKPHVPASTTTSLQQQQQPKERVSSAPPGSPSRRKRYYAWQMANGNLQSSLQESPCITPMWETVQPMATLTAKPGHVTDR